MIQCQSLGDVSSDDLAYTKSQLKASGHPLANDSTYAHVVSQAREHKNNLAAGFGGTTANVLSSYMNVFNKDDPAKYNTEVWENFQRGGFGIYTDEEIATLMYAYALMLHKVGTPEVSKTLFNIDKAGIKSWINGNPNYANELSNSSDTDNK